MPMQWPWSRGAPPIVRGCTATLQPHCRVPSRATLFVCRTTDIANLSVGTADISEAILRSPEFRSRVQEVLLPPRNRLWRLPDWDAGAVSCPFFLSFSFLLCWLYYTESECLFANLYYFAVIAMNIVTFINLSHSPVPHFHYFWVLRVTGKRCNFAIENDGSFFTLNK